MQMRCTYGAHDEIMGYKVAPAFSHETKDVSQIIVFNAKDWANKFKARLLKPGLVSYNDVDCGIILLSQQAIKNSVQTFIGRPLIIKHKTTTPATLENDAQGYITDVYFDADDGWWWCDGIVHSDAAKEAIRKMGKVSTGYAPIDVLVRKGKEHDISYDQEIKSFSGEHLAIVDNPRYEGATIRLNAKNTTNMQAIKWIKKKIASVANNVSEPAAPAATVEPAAAPVAEVKPTLENSVADETITEDTVFTIGEEQVTLKELIEARNAKAEPTAEDAIEHNGKAVKVADLIAAYDEKHAVKPAAIENAAPAAEVKPKPDHYRVLLNAPNAIPARPAQSFDTPEERLARGREMFGSAPKK